MLAKYDHALAVTNNGQAYLYNTLDGITLVDSARNRSWEYEDFKTFSLLSAQALTTLAIEGGVLRGVPSKVKGRLALAELVWIALHEQACELNHDMRAVTKPSKKKGRGRPVGANDKRIYTLLLPDNIRPENMQNFENAREKLYKLPGPMPRQEGVAWRLLIDEVIRTGERTITESRVRVIMEENEPLFRSRQDPWYLFTFYRNDMYCRRLFNMDPPTSPRTAAKVKRIDMAKQPWRK